MFYVDANGVNPVPVRYGQDLTFQSGSLDINTNEPSTVTIDNRPLFDIIAYGGLYSTQPQSFEFTTSGEIAQIMLPDQMPSFDVGYGSNTIQIFRPGDYEVNFMIRIRSTSSSDLYSGGVQINGGSFIPSTYQTNIDNIIGTIILQGSVIVSLNPGDILSLALQSRQDTVIGLNLALDVNATLTVKRLSPFP